MLGSFRLTRSFLLCCVLYSCFWWDVKCDVGILPSPTRKGSQKVERTGRRVYDGSSKRKRALGRSFGNVREGEACRKRATAQSPKAASYGRGLATCHTNDRHVTDGENWEPTQTARPRFGLGIQ